MEVGDRIRIIKPTTFHDIGDEGEIVEVDYRRLHAIIVKFPNESNTSLFPIAGHCASLFVSVEVLYKVIS